ncbi:hypothetical protein QU500_002259 [Cronobacter sakazakii]|nr:hypothetical protein [Cronobacter sakazakii]
MEIIKSSDVDPYGTEMLSRYEQSMLMKEKGNFDEAERLLISSVNPPSIFHGHYGELFKLWRKKIRKLIKAGDVNAALELLSLMFKLNSEMLDAMASYWSKIHGVERRVEYFASYSKINKTDIALFKKYSAKDANLDEVLKAEKYITSK